jgi:hypothetical protein
VAGEKSCRVCLRLYGYNKNNRNCLNISWIIKEKQSLGINPLLLKKKPYTSPRITTKKCIKDITRKESLKILYFL